MRWTIPSSIRSGALAVLGMGMGLDTGDFAAAELLEAVSRLAADRAGGTLELQRGDGPLLCDILDGTGCDYQRALWYAVSRCGMEAAVSHPGWLTELMRARAGMFRHSRCRRSDAAVAGGRSWRGLALRGWSRLDGRCRRTDR
ncbi:MAG TPA: hypothetical protein VF695_12520 [Sphingomonas sp.]|jgi:hypothetical protein